MATSCSTCLYARAPSKPPVVSGAGAAGKLAACGALDFCGSLPEGAECPHAPRPNAARTIANGLNLRAYLCIYCAPWLAIAARFSLFRTTTAATPMPSKYKPNMGAMKINIVNASGVGVMIAASTAMIRIA